MKENSTLPEKKTVKPQEIETLKQTFCRLDKFIKSKDLSDRAMSRALHMDPSMLNKIRKGTTTITWNFIRNLSMYFPELNLAWLLSGTGEMLVNEAKTNEVQDEMSGTEISSNEVEENKMSTILLQVIKLQAASLKEKDDQITKLIGLLSNKQNG